MNSAFNPRKGTAVSVAAGAKSRARPPYHSGGLKSVAICSPKVTGR